MCTSSILSSTRGITPTKIDDTRNWSDAHSMKAICKISAQYAETCRRKCKKCVFPVFQVQKWSITPTKTDTNWQYSKLSVVQWNKVIYNISAQYVKAYRRKVRKTVYCLYYKFQKGHNTYKHWRKLTPL